MEALRPWRNALSLYDILRILWRRKVALLLVTILGLYGGVTLAPLVPPLYTAEGMLLVRPEPGGTAEQVAQPLPAGWIVATEMEVLTAWSLLQEAFGRVELPPAFSEPSVLDGPVGQLRGLVPGRREAAPDPDDLRAWQFRRIRDGLEVEAGTGSFVLIIRHTSPDPHYSAAFANALMNVYVERKAERASEAKRELQALLALRRDALAARLTEAVETIEGAMTQPMSEPQLLNMNQRLEGLQRVQEALLLEEERILWIPGDGGVRVLSSAVAPPYPSSSKRVFILLAALLSTTGLATLFLVARHRPPTATRGGL